MDIIAGSDESTIEVNLFCTLFHGLVNAVHLHEPDKPIEVGRLPIKLKPPDGVEILQCECRALTCKVNELLTFLLVEPLVLLKIFTYILVIVASKGL